MTPHKCPVCNGTGLVSTPPWVAGDVETFTASDTGPWTCKICHGQGIVWAALDGNASEAKARLI